MYKLRPYQQESVSKTIDYFKKSDRPGVVVLPTGAGKSLVIAELARVARGRVLVLAHVKELVEQNHEKYESYELKAGIYSAGLNRKDRDQKVIFGSIQSVARAEEEFFEDFSLVIIDECHRISLDEATQYQQVVTRIKKFNKRVCVLGLTATPYRLDLGWIYQEHYKGIQRTEEERFFSRCIYELPLSYMIKNNYLTPPIKIDAPVACYNFEELGINNESGKYTLKDIEKVLKDQQRVTPGIVGHIIEEAKERKGVMIFASTVGHAKEILSLLPNDTSCLVTGETPLSEREEIILKFKKQEIKFLVNVSVLTTGFDAPHVDLIAIMRPTESISLYQQIVGRGLRLFDGKDDCLILDYTGQGHDIFHPEVGDKKPDSDSVPVEVICPSCGLDNTFWGKADLEGNITEHYGRKCQRFFEDEESGEIDYCNYRFRFKECQSCGEENDIAARKCLSCDATLVDPDKKLKEAMTLKDAHIMKPDSMYFEKSFDKKGRERLEIKYYDLDGESLSEYFFLNSDGQRKAFSHAFIKKHQKNPGVEIRFNHIDQIINNPQLFMIPAFVIARKNKYFWQIREKIFSYQTQKK